MTDSMMTNSMMTDSMMNEQKDIEESPQITKTLHNYDIDLVKTAFVSALFEKKHNDALYWGYELYYSDLTYETFYILNEIYTLFYAEKYADYFNLHLHRLAKEWEASNRTNHTILGSIIKNLSCLDISITDMVQQKKTLPKTVNIVNHNNVYPIDFDKSHLAGDLDAFLVMTEEELTNLSHQRNIEIPTTPQIPIYVCELLDISADASNYISFPEWCNIYAKNSVSQTVILRINNRR